MDTKPTLKERGKMVLRRMGIVVGTFAFAAIAYFAATSGVDLIFARATGIEVEQAAEPIPVSTRMLKQASFYEVPQTYVGQVEAQQDTALSFEQGGRIAEILVEEGDTVAAGQIVARLDTRTLENERSVVLAQRAALEAQAELAKLTTDRQSALEERGFSSTQAFDQARLQLAQIEAEIAGTDVSVEGIEIALSKAELVAPFSGLVGERLLDVGTQAGPGAPVLTLLENKAPILRIGLSTRAAEMLSIGDTYEAVIGGEPYRVTLQSLRPDLNMATRTRPALFSVETDGRTPLYGQTGTVTLIQRVPDTGYWVPVAALRDGADGIWTVLTVPEDSDRIEAIAVEVLYANETRAFVRGGLGEGTALVDAGPHRVVPGQLIARVGG